MMAKIGSRSSVVVAWVTRAGESAELVLREVLQPADPGSWWCRVCLVSSANRSSFSVSRLIASVFADAALVFASSASAFRAARAPSSVQRFRCLL